MKGKPVGHQFDSCLSDLQRDTVQEPTLKSFENKLGNKKTKERKWFADTDLDTGKWAFWPPDPFTPCTIPCCATLCLAFPVPPLHFA